MIKKAFGRFRPTKNIGQIIRELRLSKFREKNKDIFIKHDDPSFHLKNQKTFRRLNYGFNKRFH